MCVNSPRLCCKTRSFSGFLKDGFPETKPRTISSGPASLPSLTAGSVHFCLAAVGTGIMPPATMAMMAAGASAAWRVEAARIIWHLPQ